MSYCKSPPPVRESLCNNPHPRVVHSHETKAGNRSERGRRDRIVRYDGEQHIRSYRHHSREHEDSLGA